MLTYLFSTVRQTLDRLRIPYQEPPLDFGPFSLGDARYVEWLLSDSGWTGVRVEPVERPMIMVGTHTSSDELSTAEWLRMGPANALLEGQPEEVYAEAAKDWLQAVKERLTDQGLRFNVLLHVITAKRP
jgi:hypothetical protein